jgi:hypothetical protein
MKSLGLTLCAWIAAGFLTFPSAFSPEKSPQWPLFQKHLIDAGDSEGAAVADINRDGRPDIISGENWYEAPEWKKHQLREINPNYGNSNEVVWWEVVKGEFVRRSIGKVPNICGPQGTGAGDVNGGQPRIHTNGTDENLAAAVRCSCRDS